MTDSDSIDAASSRSRLPSPGCLFVVSLLVILASVCFWVGWPVYQQQARLEYFRSFGGYAYIETEPAEPVWLHDFVLDTLGEEHAAGFTDITAVRINQPRVTDSVLQRLSGLNNLKEIEFRHTQVTDGGLQHLSGLTNVELLYLDGTQVTDEGLKHLRGFTNLQKLCLHETQVTDAGLEHLRGLTNLQELYLGQTNVTDEGLIHLSDLTNLRILWLMRTDVTHTGAEELRSQLPGCKIWYPWGQTYFGGRPPFSRIPLPATP